MIRITQLKLSINHTPEELSQKIRKELRLKNEGFTYEIVKQSLDCRHKEDKKFVYTVDVSLQDINQENKILRKVHDNNIMSTKKKEYIFPSPGEEELKYPPVIVGSGPAGIFCAWYLARAGYRPLVLERGEEAHIRQKTVENFWKNGILDPDSNVQFGEGGAGTFSDGKLNTLVKDPSGRNHEVLKRFVQAGAPSEIIYQQKPHLGTDVLVGVVETLRHEIEEMGGEFQFRSKVTDLFFENSQLKEIEINGEKRIPAQVCVLAVGHSARDSFSMFEKKGIYMEPKSFAVGVRMEHPGLGIGQPLLRLLQLFLQQGDLQLALLRLLVGGGQLPPQGLELLLLGLRLGLGRGDLLRLGRLGRLGLRQLPPDSLQLLPVLLVRRLNIIQHILLLKPAKGGRAELKFGVAHTAHPFSTESELFYHNSRYNTSATQTMAICTCVGVQYILDR